MRSKQRSAHALACALAVAALGVMANADIIKSRCPVECAETPGGSDTVRLNPRCETPCCRNGACKACAIKMNLLQRLLVGC
ncbi:MAG: hypothetical protein D6693_04795 [Planctomycetota bacterium]|nr:MAG: hypothetical protein D6693_04795 [Planctomycetota bacterium]